MYFDMLESNIDPLLRFIHIKGFVTEDGYTFQKVNIHQLSENN